MTAGRRLALLVAAAPLGAILLLPSAASAWKAEEGEPFTMSLRRTSCDTNMAAVVLRSTSDHPSGYAVAKDDRLVEQGTLRPHRSTTVYVPVPRGRSAGLEVSYTADGQDGKLVDTRRLFNGCPQHGDQGRGQGGDHGGEQGQARWALFGDDDGPGGLWGDRDKPLGGWGADGPWSNGGDDRPGAWGGDGPGADGDDDGRLAGWGQDWGHGRWANWHDRDGRLPHTGPPADLLGKLATGAGLVVMGAIVWWYGSIWPRQTPDGPLVTTLTPRRRHPDPER
ncbi:hypothetical protein [Nonomuraea sp. NPDC003804]|uniref:hypothetical protein n=1 Tax=Nonomuraea sp. NPDC003804 TaxID=3154547 RepID=UPI0033A50D0C